MSDIKIYCESCGALKPMTIKMIKDSSFPEQGIWGDILCANCNFVIATVSGSNEGEYELAKIDT